MAAKLGILKNGFLVVLLLGILTGTVAACTNDEFESRLNQTEGTEESEEVLDTQVDSDSCEERAYREWVSEYGYVADSGPDGHVRALPNPAGLGAYLLDIEACS